MKTSVQHFEHRPFDGIRSDTDVHNYRVTAYVMEMGRALRLPTRQLRDLIAGAFLHDAGKIGVSDTILLMPGLLTPAAVESLRRHVSLGWASSATRAGCAERGTWWSFTTRNSPVAEQNLP